MTKGRKAEGHNRQPSTGDSGNRGTASSQGQQLSWCKSVRLAQPLVLNNIKERRLRNKEGAGTCSRSAPAYT